MQERDITLLLNAWGQGDQAAAEDLFDRVYQELRNLAAHHRRTGAGETLHPTALVHEAFISLVGSKLDWRDRSQFFAFTSVVMRRLVLQHARRQGAAKRGSGQDLLTFDEAVGPVVESGLDVEALDSAIHRLAELNPVQAKIVEMRFFGGLSVEETAACLDLSTRTVKRQWGMAKAWLASQLGYIGYA